MRRRPCLFKRSPATWSIGESRSPRLVGTTDDEVVAAISTCFGGGYPLLRSGPALRRLRADRDRVARFLARRPRSGHRHRRDQPTSAGADDGLGLACGGGWTTARCSNRRSPLPPIRHEDLFRDFFTLMARNGIEVGPPSAKGAGRTRPLRHGRLRQKRASPREGPDCPSRRFRPVGCIRKRGVKWPHLGGRHPKHQRFITIMSEGIPLLRAESHHCRRVAHH